MLEQEKLIERSNYLDVISYLDYQERILQCSWKTIDRKYWHLVHLLYWALDIPFPDVRKIDPTFPRFLANLKSEKTGKFLSPASLQRACGEARRFFKWARLNKAEYKKIPESWIETIQPPRSRGKQSELVKREYYSLEEIRKLVSLSTERLIDKRDRAATAFLFLTGVRIGAFVSLPVHCVDLKNQTIYQLPSEGVETKNSKALKTYILQIEDLLEIVQDWDTFIRAELGEDAFWFPNLARDGDKWVLGGEGKTESRRMAYSRGLKRMCKRTKIEYKSPHKIRHGYGVYGVKHAQTVEELKAISQNMGHESLSITDRLYSQLAGNEVKRVVVGLSRKQEKISNEELYKEFLEFKKWRENVKNRD